jgi:tetratricopeptide (TPR) repeat protein
LLLLGNTFIAVGDHENALKQYNEALKFIPDDYYALASAAQCRRALNDPTASDLFARCLGAIERSADWQRKRERMTRALIVVLAARAAKGCGDQARFDQYARAAREILSGDLTVDGLSPKFFSPTTKRLVSAKDLLAEVDQV